ncbi:MAG: hypothetical protein GY759_14240 [Chloroflexi bacterium]|nr:hypothetical protein [Chloroflexota bacterium]
MNPKMAKVEIEILPELNRVVIDSAIEVERLRYLQAGPYERTLARVDQANDLKSKELCAVSEH